MSEGVAAARDAVEKAILGYTGYQLAWAANPKAQPQDGAYAVKVSAALDVLIAEAGLEAFEHALAVLRDPHNVGGQNSAGLVELLRNSQVRQLAAAKGRQEVT